MREIDGVSARPFAPQSGPTPPCLPAEPVTWHHLDQYDLAQPRRAGAEHVDDHDPERERLPPALIVAARCDRCRLPASLDDVRDLFEG